MQFRPSFNQSLLALRKQPRNEGNRRKILQRVPDNKRENEEGYAVPMVRKTCGQ